MVAEEIGGRMAKKKTEKKKVERKPKLKDVTFNYSPGELTRTIDVEGFNPFEITFKVPRGVDHLSMGMDGARTMSDGSGIGVACVELTARHIKSWTLNDKKPTLKVLLAIREVEILAAMYTEISAAGDESKN